MDGSNIRTAKLQKERELMALQQMSYSIEQLKNRLNIMVENFEDIAEGTEEVSNVLSNWNDIKRQISLATLSLTNYFIEGDEEDKETSTLMTEGAVRVPIINSRDEEGEEEGGEEDEEEEEDEEAKHDLEENDETKSESIS